jgi:hypothetical protein
MSEDYAPGPWLVPPPGGVHRPAVYNQNVNLPTDASDGDASVLMGVAAEIVNQASPDISRFIQNSRQQHSLSGLPYGDRFMAADRMTVRHRMNSGQERIDLDVTPFGGQQNTSSTSDTNLDGYMVWVHAEPGYGDTINGRPVTCSPFAIVMNGYQIEENFTPTLSPGNTGGYVFAFGKTALVSPSLAQDLDNANPLIGNSKYRSPLKLVPSPGWGDDTGNALDGSPLNKAPRELGYWLFDWLNSLNPAQYLNFTGSYTKWVNTFSGRIAHSLGNLTLNRGIYFPNASNSILNPRGVNGVQVFSLSPSTPADFVVDLWFGEFFDRWKYRVVRQSWQVASQLGLAIKANDYPNRYLMSSIQDVEDSYVGYTANFDLSAGFSADVKDNLNNGPSTNHMSTLGGSDADVSLTADQAAIVFAWRKNNVTIYQEFAADQSTILIELLAVVTSMASVVAQAHKAAFMVRGYTGNYTLFDDLFPNDSEWYTPPGSTTPLTHGSGASPLDPTFVTGGTIVNHDGVQTVTLTTLAQVYWIQLTPSTDLTLYEENATTLGNAGIVQKYAITGTVSDVTTVSGGVSTETFVYSYSTTDIPADNSPNKIIGPGDLPTLIAEATGFIQTTMAAYSAALAAYDALLAVRPPGLLPFPDIGTKLSIFDYNYITIRGDDWSYTQ